VKDGRQTEAAAEAYNECTSREVTMLRVLLIGACLLLPALSFGANAPKTQEFVFGEELIESGPMAPDCPQVDVKKGAKFGELIRIRQDFKEKVAASVSEL
jgi:hypothetical protein